MESHDVEVLLKEKYGTHPGQRFYVKPPEEGDLVILDEGMNKNYLSWLPEHVLLPQGYPNSVSKDYTSYQIWDTAQAFCSTIMGTLATQEVLRGMGVGSHTATPMAATVTWVIKDGCGHIGRILFAYSRGTHLDAYSKKWRLYADVLNDAAMCIEMALPAFNYTTLALCVSTSMKAVVGVAGGATRIAMTQHHAIRNNLADVSAKDAAQETAVNLIASLVSLIFLNLTGNSMVLFILLMILHISFNYMAVRAVCLRTLNEPRFLQVINGYIRHELIPTPCTVNNLEPLFFYQMGVQCLDFRLCGFTIKIGHSIKKLTKMHPSSLMLRDIAEAYRNRLYLLYPSVSNRQMYVMIRERASVDDILKAYFHAVVLSTIICAINNISLGMYDYPEPRRPFAEVCRALQAADWSRGCVEKSAFMPGEFRFEPSPPLMVFVDAMVHKEWPRFRAGLLSAGWDPTKHLLLMDEWRVLSHVVTTKKVSISDQVDVYTNESLLANIEKVDKFLRDEKLAKEEKEQPKKTTGAGEVTENCEKTKDIKENIRDEATGTDEGTIKENNELKVPENEEVKIISSPGHEEPDGLKEDVKDDSQGQKDEKSKAGTVGLQEKLLGPDADHETRGKTPTSDDTDNEYTSTDVSDDDSLEVNTKRSGPRVPRPDTYNINPQAHASKDIHKVFSNENQVTDPNLQDPFEIMRQKEA